MTTKTQLLKLIRINCLNCMGGSVTEVENCTKISESTGKEFCVFYPYRFGKDTSPARKGDIRNLRKKSPSVRTKK